MTIPIILQKLDDEMFYAILDVSLDIENEILMGSSDIFIPVRRLSVRYELLYPVGSPGMMDRYCELRWKATKFLKNNAFIGSAEYREQGFHRWEGLLEIRAVDRTRFEGLLVDLKAEEDRRNPGQQMEADISSATARLLQLTDSFHRVVLRLRTRHDNRTPFLIGDEYDVQDLLAALLETRFEDIRREEWGPSYGGGATRVDFFLKKESVLVETKMTRPSLTDRKLGEELIIDIEHYKQRPECRAIICFVYDPEHHLKNPQGLEDDLSKKHGELDVRVVIRPKP